MSWNGSLEHRRLTIMYADMDVEDLSWHEYIRARKDYLVWHDLWQQGKRARNGMAQGRREMKALGISMDPRSEDYPVDPREQELQLCLWGGRDLADDWQKRCEQEPDMHDKVGCKHYQKIWGCNWWVRSEHEVGRGHCYR